MDYTDFRIFFSRMIVLLFIVFCSGCAVIADYSVGSYDYNRIEESLRLRALQKKIEHSVRINNIGYRLIKSVPRKPRKDQYYVGILTTPVEEYVSRLYGIEGKSDELLIYGVVKDSPADKAGFIEKDILVSFEGRRINNKNLDNLFAGFKPDKKYNFQVRRDDRIITLILEPEAVSFNIPFIVVEDAEINVLASPSKITVSYGLINFSVSDDEIAVTMAHEMAHLINSYLLRDSGVGLFSKIIAIAVGRKEPPQSGDLGSGSSDSFTGYSEPMERIADIDGIIYAHRAGFDIEKAVQIWERFFEQMPQSMATYFGSTHPTSPERLSRLREIIKKIQNGNFVKEKYIN